MATCFEYTVEYASEEMCKDGGGNNHDIPFTANDPTGYYGRICGNNPYSSVVGEAIVFLRDGGQLSGLSQSARDSYLDVVDLVMDDVEARCRAAAPGQCIDAAQVCAGIVADMYAALVTNETCVLQPGGEVAHELGPLETCHHQPVFYGFGTDAVDYCDGEPGADEMADPPFGDIQALVSCNPQTSCEVDRQLLRNIQSSFSVFLDEEVTLDIVDSMTQCGPGAQIGGLDSGEDAKALADAFDVRNGDVIRQIASIYIEDVADAAAAVTSLLQDPSTTIVIHRPQSGPGCDTLTYTIDVP
jgi:hypothetical protein